ncbi:MAG: DUF6273 domain-containing protein [bacterium]|nr:DUF6273 domain-containing protein [bacterium]
MNTFKCQTCGQPLRLDPKTSVYVCDSCHIPRLRPKTENRRSAYAPKHGPRDIDYTANSIFKSLQDGFFLIADKKCDALLKNDPRHARAHLGKLLAALQCRSTAALAVSDPSFGENYHFQQALRYATPELQRELKSYLQAAADLQTVKAGPSAQPSTAQSSISPVNGLKHNTSSRAASSWKQRWHSFLGHNYAKYYVGAAIFLMAIPSGMLVGSPLSHDREYRAAKQYMQAANYEQASQAFSSLHGYKDSAGLADQCRYEYARQLQQAGQFSHAKVQYDSLADYRDSVQRSQECLAAIESAYQQALSTLDRQEWTQAKQNLTEISGYRDSQQLIHKCDSGLLLQKIGNTPVGQSFCLGAYIARAGEQPQPLEWRVLQNDKHDVLAVTVRGIDYLTYSDSPMGQTWQYSAVRRWLNGEFLQEAFTESERLCLADAHIITRDNPQFNTPGCATYDKVFLLSIEEAQRYFRDDDDRVCKATDYANNLSDWQYADQTNWWWLRSPGRSLSYASIVSQEGAIDYLSYQETANRGLVRPAIKLKRLTPQNIAPQNN